MTNINFQIAANVFNRVYESFENKQTSGHRYICLETLQNDFIKVSSNTDRDKRAELFEINAVVKECLEKCQNLTTLKKIEKGFKKVKFEFGHKQRSWIESFWYWIFGGNEQLAEAKRLCLQLHRQIKTLEKNQIKIEFEEVKPEVQRILDTFPPSLVEALGGVKEILKLPVNDQVIYKINENHLKGPVTIGWNTDQHPYLLFSLKHDGLMEVFGEFIGITKKPGLWEAFSEGRAQLFLGIEKPIDKDDTVAWSYICDKIKRLRSGQPIGQLGKFSSDKSIPKDSYLEKDALTKYMTLDTAFYERKPEYDERYYLQ